MRKVENTMICFYCDAVLAWDKEAGNGALFGPGGKLCCRECWDDVRLSLGNAWLPWRR